MSQKKLKRLRRLEKGKVEIVKKEERINRDGIRGILKKNWKFLLVLCLGIFALYFNSLWGDFVSDDYATIPQNPEIMNFSDGMSRWIVGLINWFLAVTFGITNPIAYHLTNLVFYLIALLLVFVFLKVVFTKGLVPYFSTLIFAFLPIHVEAVSWVSGKPYLLNAITVLLSLILFILHVKTGKKKYLTCFIASLFLAFVAERVRSIALVILSILYWVSFDNPLKKKVGTKKIFIVLGIILFLSLLILFPTILDRVKAVNSGTNVSDSIFYNPFFQYPTAMAKYLQLILVPTDLTLYHTMYVLPVWLNWLILLVYLINLVYFWFRDKKIFFALAFIFGATAPSMAPVKVSWLVAERYMFLGSLGMALLLGMLAEKFWKKKVVVIIVLSLLIGVYSIEVFMRNIDWQTNHNLWVRTCQVSPNSHNAWNNIGDDYDKLASLETTEESKYRQYLNALKGFAQSFTIKPNYADAYHNQANILYKIGRLDLARQGYEKALSYNPNLTQTLKTLVQLDLMEKNLAELDNHLAKLRQLNPDDLEVAYLTAVAYVSTGRANEVRDLVERMYRQFPNVAEVEKLYKVLESQPESATGSAMIQK